MKGRKDALTWVLVGFALLLVGVAAAYAIWPQLQPHATVRIGDGVYAARVAKTAEDRQKGLLSTTELRQDQALLMVFGSDGKWPIHMKGMKYPIDIVWLNKDKEVVYIVKNAPPDEYETEVYVPKQDARYVVELPAGMVAQKSISIGAMASFDENNLEGWGQ